MPTVTQWLPPALLAIFSFAYGCLRLYILYQARSETRQSCDWMLGA